MIAFSSAVSSLSRDWEKYLNNPFVFINFLDDDVFLHLMSDGLNFSVMRKARLPVQQVPGRKAISKLPTTERFSLTKSVPCRLPCSRSFCACFRKTPFTVWAERRQDM